ncbi:hypothetical protein CsatB_004964 [Cannabis sativa]|uniref:MLO-like protein 4 isoform X1 n=1 Tax=Cannabis sativa TaxID=3483 RepID=UPI0029CA42B9|nr:MLO-like protein 4 isoform X1 [Cannabis sativa]
MENEHSLLAERSLAETPSWAFASVVAVLVSFGFFFQISLNRFGNWLDRTKRKSLFAALEKIKEELMLFGLLSLLMGHWIVIVAKICVKTSVLSSRFYPCGLEEIYVVKDGADDLSSSSDFVNNKSVYKKHFSTHHFCSEGHESFASYESLEQLHRSMFVLGITHVLYSFAAIALAMLKIYSWRVWENEAKSLATHTIVDAPEARPKGAKMKRMSTFIDHHTSHPWSQHKILVWLLCFSRQFWSSINRSDYMALRLGFITNHQLPLSYDFHNYMLRSMEEEFRDIVGISIPLWIYTIFCIFLDFHGSNIYFWLSFFPAILILLIGTKLHRVVVKLAVEIMDRCPYMENHQFKLRDELFWFKRPKLLLHCIQLISFQNAFEMATFIWSLWEIREPSCFMDNRKFIVVRLSFGVISQFWCSFVTFPLYVIITQMGSRFKKTVITDSVRKSLMGWQRRVKAKHSQSTTPLLVSDAATSSSESLMTESIRTGDDFATTSTEGSSTGSRIKNHPYQRFEEEGEGERPTYEINPENLDHFASPYDIHSNDYEIRHRNVNNDVVSP